jgi:hypothetical protein
MLGLLADCMTILWYRTYSNSTYQEGGAPYRFHFPTSITKSDEIEEDAMGRTCGTHDGGRNSHKLLDMNENHESVTFVR